VSEQTHTSYGDVLGGIELMHLFELCKASLRPLKPRNLKRSFISCFPTVLHSGSRAFCQRVDVAGLPHLKKKFSTGERPAICMRNEVLARALFEGKRWMSPILEKGDDWILLPLYPKESRLDIAVQMMKSKTKREVARQALWALFDMFCAGYAHCDFHAKNLFWIEGQLVVTDFEKMELYPEGAKPSFPKSFDVVGKGLERAYPDRTNMCYVARTNSGMSLLEVLGVSLYDALEMIKSDLKTQMLRASLEFQSGRQRHSCKGARLGKIYCSFELPELSVSRAEAQRDSKKRLADLGLNEDVLKGKRLLDLGCHIGGMIFESQKFAPAYSVGIEYDCEKVKVARLIAAYCGQTNVRFVQGDIDNIAPGDIGGEFDVVFCFALEAHVKDKNRFYELLSKLTGETLYFEGNGNTDPNTVKTSLKDTGFKSVTQLGFSDSDCYAEKGCETRGQPRPIFVACK